MSKRKSPNQGIAPAATEKPVFNEGPPGPQADLEAEPALALANAKLMANDFVGAEDICAEQVVRTPRSVNTLHLLAVALLGQRKTEDATRVLSSAISLEPGRSALWFNLAQALLRLPKPDPTRAMQAIERVLALNPQDQQAQQMHALMLRAAQGVAAQPGSAPPEMLPH